MSYTPILTDPTEWNESETEKCTLCHSDLNNEEVTEQDDHNDLDTEEIAEEIDYCFECFYSCCGDELDQDVRMCPTCKEHN